MTRRGEGYGELLRIFGERVEDREILVFFLATIALGVLLAAERRGLRLRDGWLVRCSLCALVLGLFVTVVEGLFVSVSGALDLLEHSLYLIHTGLLVAVVLRGGPRLSEGHDPSA